jgi:hypothetical protein
VQREDWRQPLKRAVCYEGEIAEDGAVRSRRMSFAMKVSSTSTEAT